MLLNHRLAPPDLISTMAAVVNVVEWTIGESGNKKFNFFLHRYAFIRNDLKQ